MPLLHDCLTDFDRQSVMSIVTGYLEELYIMFFPCFQNLKVVKFYQQVPLEAALYDTQGW